MEETCKNLIGGKWVDAAAGATFEDLNPANKTDVLGAFPRSDHRDVDRAVEAAKTHAADWRRVAVPQRAEVLFRCGDLLTRQADELARLITREVGKVLVESQAEVGEAIRVFSAIAAQGERLWAGAAPADEPGRIRTSLRVPLGTVAVITPWNFPLALPATKLALALLAGNGAVFKPAKDAPLTANRLVQILQEAGVPPGAMSVVHGLGEEAGAPLVRHPDVALVSFTGSREVAREVAIACAADQRGLLLDRAETGAVLVAEDADLDLAVEGSVWGALRLSGQRSTAAGRVLVHKKVLKEFADRLVARVQALRLGDGMLAGTDLGPLINEAQLKRVHGYTKIGVKEGAKILCGGEVCREGECRRGFFYPPTVLGEAALKMRISKEEIFGPTLALVSAASLEEACGALGAMRSHPCGLLYSRDVGRALRAVGALRTGCVAINAAAEALRSTGAVGCPAAGLPVDGPQALDALTTWRTVAVDYGAAAAAP